MTKVLVAEDDPDIRELLVIRLSSLGYDVVAVADGPEALSVASVQPPEVALLDVSMPRMSGLEVCRRLRARPATARILIVMISARAQSSDVDAGFLAGANDYLSKPFRLNELTSRLEALLAGAGR